MANSAASTCCKPGYAGGEVPTGARRLADAIRNAAHLDGVNACELGGAHDGEALHVSICAPIAASRCAVASVDVTRETVIPRRVGKPAAASFAAKSGSQSLTVSTMRWPSGSAIGVPSSRSSSKRSLETTTPLPIFAAPSKAPAIPAFTTSL